MAVMIDRPVWPGRGRRWSHLASDTSLAELHTFARTAGLPLRAFERDHYDVPAERYDALVEAGAVPVSSRELVRRLQHAGLRRRKSDWPSEPVRAAAAESEETPDVDWSQHSEAMAVEHDVERSLDADMAGWLVRDGIRRVVDVGCGTGGMTVALATAMPTAEVVGVDSQPKLLAAAANRARVFGVGPRFVQGDLHGDLSTVDGVEPGKVDLFWASSVLHHLPDQQRAVAGLASLLSPGGRLAVAEGGLRLRSLPWDVGLGKPGLEMRLDGVQEQWFGRMRRSLPGSLDMPYGWDTAMRRAGLGQVDRRSFLLEVPPPLPGAALAHVVDRLRGFLDRPERTAMVDPDDLATIRRLTDRDDAAFLGHRDDVFLLVARTVFVGTAS